MNVEQLFIEQPSLEWHNNIPYALARLNVEYAHILAKLALEQEPYILTLPVNKKWLSTAKQNPTGARYSSYNTFLLHPDYQLLWHALKNLYRFYQCALHQPYQANFIQSWINIHRIGQRLHRHYHCAKIIGTFWAQATGSNTRYGITPKTNAQDHIFQNQDGQLMITAGPNNYHEVSIWKNPKHARISYAFDIIDATSWRSDRVLLPFES